MASRMGRRRPEGPSPIDEHVGKRLRLRRTLLGITQEQLGRAIDLTFQQVQKYEIGANRISASRLYDFCRILHVPISYFFDDIDAVDAARGDVSHPTGAAPAGDPALRRETLELVRAYYRIPDQNTRRRIMELVIGMAAGPPKNGSG